jgi:hypothetical protein
MSFFLALASMGLLGVAAAAEPPRAEIGNGPLRAKMYLPDAKAGYYRGTRFDWSGVIYSLTFKGHEYYGPWFQRSDPKVHDFVYEGADIVAGPCSAVTGPVDEFGEMGFEAAKPGGTFVKIGIGALRRPDTAAYDKYRLYDIADGGKWTVERKGGSMEFRQVLNDAGSGYGYTYTKVVRLVEGKPEMALEHRLRNTGGQAIRTNVYNHNFLTIDGLAPGPDYTIEVPFQIQSRRPPEKTLAEIRGNRIVYLKTLEGRDVVQTSLGGFGDSAKDHEIRIENRKAKAGVVMNADRPLLREALWSIRSVISMEPFIALNIEPGAEFTWTSTYRYYTLP